MKHWDSKWLFIGILVLLSIFPKIVLCSTFHSTAFDSSRVVEDPWFGQDKAKHFLASMLLTGSATYLAHAKADIPQSQSQIIGIGFAVSLGFIKECHDQMRPFGRFSWKDLAFDMLGIGVGILCFSWW